MSADYMNKLLLAGLITASFSSLVQAKTPFESFASASPEVGQILIDVGNKCGVDAKQANGMWLGHQLGSGVNTKAKDKALAALYANDQVAYQAAISSFICIKK